MRTTFIPNIFKSALNEQGFKTHQKKTGDMTFWKVSSYKMRISFYGEERRNFYIKVYVGGLNNEQEVKLGNICCIENNSHMHMAKLIVEEGKIKAVCMLSWATPATLSKRLENLFNSCRII